jgi:hypothetical protein
MVLLVSQCGAGWRELEAIIALLSEAGLFDYCIMSCLIACASNSIYVTSVAYCLVTLPWRVPPPALSFKDTLSR